MPASFWELNAGAGEKSGRCVRYFLVYGDVFWQGVSVSGLQYFPATWIMICTLEVDESGFTEAADILFITREKFERQKKVMGTLAEVVWSEGQELYAA